MENEQTSVPSSKTSQAPLAKSAGAGHSPAAREGKSGRSQHTSKTHKASLNVEIFWGLMLCASLALFSLWFSENTFIGRQFELFSYRVLQGQLKPGEAVVTIVDISDLPPEGKEQVTPRKKLQWILQAVAQHEPKVIGVDIDFSPETKDRDLQYENGAVKYLTKDDPDFFRFCLGLNKVYLGIFRTELLPSDKWLGDGAFSRLAASLWIPHEARSVARSIALSGESDERKIAAPTMSAALATAFHESNHNKGIGHTLRKLLFAERNAVALLEETDDEESKRLKLDESYVDYSLVRGEGRTFAKIHLPKSALRDERTLDAVIESGAEQIQGHIVLIGDVSRPTDVFVNPALGKTLPGVEIQAAAANTFATHPLYVLPTFARFWLDFIMAATVFLLWLFLSRRHLQFDRDRLLTMMIVLSAAAVITAAMLVNVTHVVWNDFLFIALGLAVHPVTHRTLHRLSHHFSTVLREYLSDKGHRA